ncbi:hypothetical protein [Kitasatospora sp. GP82]|uniref:hypothetical protein n=1 Tax=Kitasatospora sp. GP82 TaxID=3035089 RepID=UPI0024770FC4|nr:hypothetical protein [Kitasatospora sp. GP82]MDH6129787.1 hypothetical protein [Kitasatospora sp. GP82]
MGDYYDFFIAVDISADLDAVTCQEIGWHLGCIPEEPNNHRALDNWDDLGGPFPVFAGGIASHAFPGVDVCAMLRTSGGPLVESGPIWALTIRKCIHEDEFGVAIDVIEWILSHGAHEGVVGHVKGSSDDILGMLEWRQGCLNVVRR